MNECWNYLNLSCRPLDPPTASRIWQELNHRLEKLRDSGDLSSFYVSVYQDHLRVGLRTPYRREQILKNLKSLESEWCCGVEEPKKSIELDEIEDSKELAGLSLGTSCELIGKTGRLAHLIHHYLNQSQIDRTGEVVAEGEHLFSVSREKYDKVSEYLQGGLLFIAELYSQWSTIGNRQGRADSLQEARPREAPTANDATTPVRRCTTTTYGEG
jgi:hypothetical protein